jgi:hypothetical protein
MVTRKSRAVGAFGVALSIAARAPEKGRRSPGFRCSPPIMTEARAPHHDKGPPYTARRNVELGDHIRVELPDGDFERFVDCGRA